MASQEGEFLVDIECGGTTSEEEGNGDVVSGNNRGRGPSNKSSNGLTSNVIDIDNLSRLNDFGGQGAQLLIDKNSGSDEGRDLASILEKRNSNEQRKKTGPKKASKPPRPPKGPILTASDLKLVKELSELAARKRARIEQIKAFRKMKETKRSSSGNCIVAMVITVVFFFILILQGIFSGHSFAGNFQGSPAPAMANEGLISIELLNNAPTYDMNQPISQSPNSVELTSGSSPQEQEGRDAG